MLAFLLLALGGAAWLVAAVVYQLQLLPLLGIVVLTLGFGAAAWGARSGGRRAIGGGLAGALVGMLLFLGNDLGSFIGLATRASHLFALGIAGALAAHALGERAPAWLARASWGVSALGALLWTWSDLAAGLAWQPGNLLALVGCAWLAAAPPDETFNGAPPMPAP